MENFSLESDTIVGVHYKSMITLVERLSKAIITVKPDGRKVQDIDAAVNNWFQFIPKTYSNPLRLIVEKKFLIGKLVVIKMMWLLLLWIQGHPPDRALNEHSSGLLRKDGLPKEMNFNHVDQHFVSTVALIRNLIPRKSLHYQTPLEVF